MSYTPMGAPDKFEYVLPSREEPRIIYVLVLLPLLQLIQFPGGTFTWGPTLGLAAVIAAIAIPTAFADQRTLIANAHVRRTSPWLAALPIVYLGVRGSRRFDETQRGMTPFWVGLVIVVVVFLLLFWGPEGVLALLF